MVITSISKDGKYGIEFDEEPHVYRMWQTSDPRRKYPVPGVTTFNKDGYPESIQLSMWKAGEAGKYAVNALLEYLSKTEEIKERDLDAIVKSSKRAWLTPAKKAANIGTIVHDYAYANTTGQPFDDSQLLRHPDPQKVLACVAKFREWNETKLGILKLAETIVGSARLHFAGKFDRLDEMPNGILRIRDYKTSSGIFLDMFAQMVSYGIAIEEWLGLPIGEYEVVRFGKTDGEFETKTSMQYAEEKGVSHEDFIQALKDQVARSRGTYDFRNFYDKV